MKPSIINLKKLVAWAILSIVLISLAFIVITLLQHPLEVVLSQSVEELALEGKPSKNIEIDQGSVVNLNELLAFSLFARSIANSSERKNVATQLESDGGKIGLYKVKEAISLEELVDNDCSEINCFQHRIPMKILPGIFWKGLIGIEDFRFLDHVGIDPQSLLRAFVANLKQLKYSQGGSTLTQQLAKNLFLSQEKTILRKLKEMVISVYLDLVYSKEAILEMYFNEVFWGALQGVKLKGVFAATTFYFAKQPREINAYEAAILISMLKGPNFYNPLRSLETLRSRADLVFNKLIELKLYSDDSQNAWSEAEWKKWRATLNDRENDKILFSLWNKSTEGRGTFDSYDSFVFRNKSNTLLEDLHRKLGDQDFTVKAYIARPFNTDGRQQFTYYSKTERPRKRAIEDEKHQIGSTLKPILYGIFTENGKLMTDKVSTLPIELSLKSGRWQPKESHKINESEVTLMEALMKSYNRPVIRLAQEVGFKKMELNLQAYIPQIKTPLEEFPAQLLGSIELSIKNVFEIYYKFISEQCKNRINKDSENIVEMLSTPKLTTVGHSIGRNLEDLKFFGKTGTSNNGNDSWYTFFDGNLLGVIWVGLEKNHAGEDLQLYGSNTAFRIFQEFARDRGKRFNEFSCDIN